MIIEDFLNCPSTDLARKTSINKVQWSHYFHERRSMSLRTLCKLANQLEMSPDTLLVALLKRIEVQKEADAEL